eukprot:scaffold35746_cov189-Skeletonema_dohrnii-CCMP3373.AAC.1
MSGGINYGNGIMFYGNGSDVLEFLDSFTLICGGNDKATDPVEAVPEHEAELSLKEHGKDDAADEVTLVPDEVTLLEPVDPMDAKNYLVTHLSRPMGILFEENFDVQHGGAFVAEINEGCSAAADGSICRGDQLIAIGDKRVSGMDFEEVMKLIVAGVEMKPKLSFFRGPAESLYGPSGASLSWLDEFVAERGEEAALVEDSESEVVSNIEDVAAPQDLLDVAGLAVAAVDGDEIDETFFTAHQTLVDAEAHVEKEPVAAKAEEALVVDENEDDADGEVRGETDPQKDGDETEVEETVAVVENEVEAAGVGVALEADVVEEADAAVSATLIEDDADAAEVVECEAEVEKVADSAVGATPLIEVEVELDEADEEVDADEEVKRDCEVENEADAVAEAVLVEDEDDDDEEVAGDALPEADAPILNEAVNKASKDWLDNYLANPESQLVSNDEGDAADMADGATLDLETRCKQAVEVKEAALAAVVEEKNSNSAKGILKESRYSPKGVDEIKMFDSDPVSTKESIDDDSAASSVWSEQDDYIGQVLEEEPVRVGSSLAAMGVASSLATNMMST